MDSPLFILLAIKRSTILPLFKKVVHLCLFHLKFDFWSISLCSFLVLTLLIFLPKVEEPRRCPLNVKLHICSFNQVKNNSPHGLCADISARYAPWLEHIHSSHYRWGEFYIFTFKTNLSQPNQSVSFSFWNLNL